VCQPLRVRIGTSRVRHLTCDTGAFGEQTLFIPELFIPQIPRSKQNTIESGGYDFQNINSVGSAQAWDAPSIVGSVGAHRS